MPRKNKIIIRTGTGAPSASDFVTGEPAFDSSAGSLYIKNAAGTMAQITGGGGGGSGSVDVYEFATTANFPATGAAAVIYIATDTGRTYRWAGTAYIEMGPIGGDVDSLLRSLLVPPAPTGLTATVGNTQVSLSWTAPTGVLSQAPVTDYREQYSTDGGTTWTTFTAAASTATNATVTGLTNGQAVRFRVAAVNAVGVGAYSTASSAVTPNAGDPLFSSVQLLLRGDTSIADASAYARSVTATGSASVSTAQKKWGAGSIAFNGGAGYAVAASNAAYNLGSGNWVIEGWVYFNSVNSDQRIAGGDIPNVSGNFNWAWYTTTSGRLDYYLSSNGSSFNLASGVQFGSIAINQWYHVALVRNGNTVTPYLNGTAGTTSSVGSSSIFNNTSNGPFVGAQGSSYFNGFIDDFRFTVGNNRGYTGSTITVPTAAFPEASPGTDPLFSSVSLLLHADGTGNTFVDSSATPKTITAVGNATQSTAESKFGGKSAFFDGTGDYLRIADSGSGFLFGAGDFCYEFWFRSAGSNEYATFLSRPWNGAGGFNIFANAAEIGRPEVWWREANGGTAPFLASDTGGYNDNNWHHLVFNRNGTTCRLFIDGVVRATATSSTSVASSTIDVATDNTFGGRDFTGYIDDLRITKGVARYTANFTPPTAAFPHE